MGATKQTTSHVLHTSEKPEVVHVDVSNSNDGEALETRFASTKHYHDNTTDLSC